MKFHFRNNIMMTTPCFNILYFHTNYGKEWNEIEENGRAWSRAEQNGTENKRTEWKRME